MEAFGAASSATAVVGAVADVAKETVKFLRCLKNAPLAVFALIEEVTQLQSVIDVVKGACESDQCPPSILTLLEQAKARLLDLNCLIDSKLTKEKGSVDTDRLAWVRHERHAKALMERLRNTRNNITAVLSVSTLYVLSLTGVLSLLLREAPNFEGKHDQCTWNYSSALHLGEFIQLHLNLLAL